MDTSRFDHLARRLADGKSRRGLLRAFAGVSLVSASALLVTEGGNARTRRGRGVQGEHWKKKKRTYCLNGQTIRRLRRKQDKLLAMGATLGTCTEPVCTPDCAGKECGPDGCGGVCGAGCNKGTCCNSKGACVEGSTDDACGIDGNMCAVCPITEMCIDFICIDPS